MSFSSSVEPKSGGGGGTATVLGFGGRTPAVVLELLSSWSTIQDADEARTIRLERSGAMEEALAAAPYRTFLRRSGSPAAPTTNSLLVYQLPASWIEYVSAVGAAEAHRVRTAILQQPPAPDTTTTVVAYDPVTDRLVGTSNTTTVEEIVTAVGSSSNASTPTAAALRAALARATLQALAALDQQAAEHALSPPKKTR